MGALYDIAQTYLIPIQLVLAMIGMGATLTPRDFALVAKNPVGLAYGLVMQLVFVPALALGVIDAFGLTKGWAVGFLLVAVVPGGAWSNLLTYVGKGNVPLSIAMTTASTAGCIVTIPLLLELLAAAHLPDEFVLPIGRIVLEILAYLLVPLIVGMLLLRFAPRPAPTASRWCIRASIGLIVVITIAALGSGRMPIAAYGFGPPLLVLGFGFTLVNGSLWILRLLRRYDDDNLALSIEVTVRNIGVALLLIHNFFPGEEAQGHVLYVCLFYAGMSFFIGLPAVFKHRSGKGPAPFSKPFPKPARTAGELDRDRVA